MCLGQVNPISVFFKQRHYPQTAIRETLKTDKIHSVIKLDGDVTKNGHGIMIRARVEDGEPILLGMPTSGASDVISLICHLVQRAGKIDADPPKELVGKRIEASHLSFGEGENPDEAILGDHLGQMTLVVALPKHGIRPLFDAVQSTFPDLLSRKPN